MNYAKSKLGDLYAVDEKGRMFLDFHEGQLNAWDSKKRFIAVVAGTQGGKTSFGPHWLRREIALKGPGDYLIVTPTFVLMKLKAMPEFIKLFQDTLGLGEYRKGSGTFFFSKEGEIAMYGEPQVIPTRIIFGHAMNPESLESATAKGAWLDEAGQNAFKLGAWEAIQRRLSIHQGRALITTTPYNWGWLKTDLHDRWLQAGMNHPYIDIIRFKSNMNPMFPDEEYERAKEALPHWKFKMFYDAEFTRPAGMIYEDFTDEQIIEPFDIPEYWPRYMGVDFGGVNTAAIFVAYDPDKRLAYVYREYHGGGISIKEHASRLLHNEPIYPMAYGGAPSENQWRDEFGRAGLTIRQPTAYDVEVGISRVIKAHKSGRYFIFNTCRELIEQKRTYSRAVNENGNPIDKIQDKETYHLCDAERYIMTYLTDELTQDVTFADAGSIVDIYSKRRNKL